MRVATEDGQQVLLTEGHYLYVNGKLEMAGLVGQGDYVVLGNGTRSIVSEVSRKRGRGLFNPQTIHGDVVVDGVVCSTYTYSVAPTCAHALLAPLRGAFLAFKVDFISSMFP